MLKANCALIILLTLFTVTSKAQRGQQSRSNSKYFYISGQLKGDISSIKRIQFSSYDNFTGIIASSFDIDTTLILNKKGEFSFCIPHISKFRKSYILIVYNSMLNEYGHRGDLLSEYVTEPGDSIKMIIHTSGDSLENVIFSGRGASKYRCRRELEIEYQKFREERVKQTASPGWADYWWNSKNLAKIMELYTNYQASMLSILEAYKPAISPTAYLIMKADIYGLISGLWERQILNYYSRIDTSQKKRVLKFYFTHRMKTKVLPDSILAFSSAYINYLIDKEKTELAMKRNIPENEVSFHNLYYAIRNEYTGKSRELMLLNLISDPIRNDSLILMPDSGEKYIQDALLVIKTPSFRKKLMTALNLGNGVQAYDFSLPDTSGRIISLKDLKGDVVLMDMWFVGCTGCAMFSQRFQKEIYPEFKNNPQFKVVSINTDSKKEDWLKGLHSGIYSEMEFVNLHLDNVENEDLFKSPIIKHYGIEGFPFIILIDKNGRIIAQISNADKTSDIINKINQSLIGQ